jgi:hypothetical protein
VIRDGYWPVSGELSATCGAAMLPLAGVSQYRKTRKGVPRPQESAPPRSSIVALASPGRHLVSPLTRYGFAALIILYGIYQLSNDRLITGLIGVLVGALILYVGRRR